MKVRSSSSVYPELRGSVGGIVQMHSQHACLLPSGARRSPAQGGGRSLLGNTLPQSEQRTPTTTGDPLHFARGMDAPRSLASVNHDWHRRHFFAFHGQSYVAICTPAALSCGFVRCAKRSWRCKPGGGRARPHRSPRLFFIVENFGGSVQAASLLGVAFLPSMLEFHGTELTSSGYPDSVPLRPGDPPRFSSELTQPPRQGALSGRQASPASHVTGGASHLASSPTLASTGIGYPISARVARTRD
ncbi:hypothetical protein J6590_079059 [Homalodisca vitripennis]|nr:hypothetical protein J6590_079059 [Homalodisca vitripennis]